MRYTVGIGSIPTSYLPLPAATYRRRLLSRAHRRLQTNFVRTGQHSHTVFIYHVIYTSRATYHVRGP